MCVCGTESRLPSWSRDQESMCFEAWLETMDPTQMPKSGVVAGRGELGCKVGEYFLS